MKRWCFGLLLFVLLTSAAAFAADFGKTKIDLDGKLMRAQETNLGDFVTDAVRNAVEADFAVIQSAAFTQDANIPTGIVTEQTMRDSLASPTSPVVTLKLKAAEVKSMMERALGKVPEENTAFLQISGMVVVFNSDRPQDERVESITVDGKALDFTDEKTEYIVAMPRELGLGGQGYLRIFPVEAINAMTTSEITLIDAVKKEFDAQKGEISPEMDARLQDTCKKKEVPNSAEEDVKASDTVAK